MVYLFLPLIKCKVLQRQQKTVAKATATIALHFMVKPKCQGYLVYASKLSHRPNPPALPYKGRRVRFKPLSS